MRGRRSWRGSAAAAALLAAQPAAGAPLDCSGCQNIKGVQAATLLHAKQQCLQQTANLGNSFPSPEACAAVARDHPGCSGPFMWSKEYWSDWGCRCCEDGGADNGSPHQLWSVYTYQPELACNCTLDWHITAPFGLLDTTITGNMHIATRECSHVVSLTGDVEGTEFNYDVGDTQNRDLLLAALAVCPVSLRFDTVSFSEDGVRLCPRLDFGQCGDSGPMGCIELAAQDSCLQHDNCGDCVASPHGGMPGCGWCFDTGSCLPRSAKLNSDRCGTCQDWADNRCPLSCPGVGGPCSGHGNCSGDPQDRFAQPRCDCAEDWSFSTPAGGAADCAVYLPPDLLLQRDPCPNLMEEFHLTIGPSSLTWADGWLFAVWRAPAQGVAQLGVGVVKGTGADRRRRDDVAWRLRFGAPPAGDAALDDFAWDGDGAPVGSAGSGAQCLTGSPGDYQYVAASPSYRSADIWVALRWADPKALVDIEVIIAEVRCAAGYAGDRCSAPLTRTDSLWFNQADSAGSERVSRRAATVRGAVGQGSWHYVEVTVPQGTQELNVTVTETSAPVQLWLQRGGVPPGKHSWAAPLGESSMVLPLPEPSPKWFVGVFLPAGSADAARFQLRIELTGCPIGRWGLRCEAAELLMVTGRDARFGPRDWTALAGRPAARRYVMLAVFEAPPGAAAVRVTADLAGNATGALRLGAAPPALAASDSGETEWESRGDGGDSDARPPPQSGYSLQWTLSRPVAGQWTLLLTAASPLAVTLRAAVQYCDQCQDNEECVTEHVVVCLTPEIAGKRITAPCPTQAMLSAALGIDASLQRNVPENSQVHSCRSRAAAEGTSAPVSPGTSTGGVLQPSPPPSSPPSAAQPSQGGGSLLDHGGAAASAAHSGVSTMMWVIIGVCVAAAIFVAGAAWHARRQRRRRAAGEYDVAPSAQQNPELQLEEDEWTAQPPGTADRTGCETGEVRE